MSDYAVIGCRAVIASIDEDPERLDDIIATTSGVELLRGLLHVARILGQLALGDDPRVLREFLDRTALEELLRS